MRLVAISVVICLVAAAPGFALGLDATRPPKVDVEGPEPVFEFRDGGETVDTAVPIPSLPFVDTGNTCGHVNDYDEGCPYFGSTSPDLVYSYVAPYDMCVDVSLCNSFYDTKVYIYEGGWTPGVPIACNDDNFDCVDPPVMYTSLLEGVEFAGGEIYYVVVDGYGRQCGDYLLEIDEVDCSGPCVVECPPDGIDEGEGPCYDGYEDHFNGGCGSNPVVFSELSPSSETITICGLSGNYNDNQYRETDWYLLDLTCELTTIAACVTAEFEVSLVIIDLREGCAGFYPYRFATADACETVCMTETLPPGEWAVWVSVSGWFDVPCDSDYVLTIDGYEACWVPVERESWGTIKGLYR